MHLIISSSQTHDAGHRSLSTLKASSWIMILVLQGYQEDKTEWCDIWSVHYFCHCLDFLKLENRAMLSCCLSFLLNWPSLLVIWQSLDGNRSAGWVKTLLRPRHTKLHPKLELTYYSPGVHIGKAQCPVRNNFQSTREPEVKKWIGHYVWSAEPLYEIESKCQHR